MPPQSITSRSLSVTDVSEHHHLGTHSPPSPGSPSGSIWDRYQWSHHTATAQSIPLPALPRGCHPPAGPALPGWDPCVLRASSAALSPGAARGVRAETETAQFLLTQAAAQPHMTLLHMEITGREEDEQSHSFLLCHPRAHGGNSRGWETPNSRGKDRRGILGEPSSHPRPNLTQSSV